MGDMPGLTVVGVLICGSRCGIDRYWTLGGGLVHPVIDTSKAHSAEATHLGFRHWRDPSRCNIPIGPAGG